MISSQCLLVISFILLVNAEVPSWPSGRTRIDKRFSTNNLFANAQWHLASDFDDTHPLHPDLRHFGTLGQTRAMLSEGPLGTFRFGKRNGGRSTSETLYLNDQFN
ncbi:hypothetical protein V3C99_017435 [Haemonchus contortus]|uniref:Secreted protein n=1 Tax=Haemonchus contortus TaxID=6289 RepID=A0A7I4Z7M9_HAECO|nr:unnamed protein product [Haemonchus contortus]